MSAEQRILEVLSAAKRLAQEYRALTGKPLGVTGEVAEYEAARLLGVELTPARNAGYDAIRRSDGRRFQIKGRCMLSGCKPGQQMGSIDISKEFDAVLLVLLDENLDANVVHQFMSSNDLLIFALYYGIRSRKLRNEPHTVHWA